MYLKQAIVRRRFNERIHGWRFYNLSERQIGAVTVMPDSFWCAWGRAGEAPCEP
ncbi:hypothetical protein ALQ88_00057 [Pseudomonas savastanoi]|nr:hypothetical protein AC519_0547 [Pseudomonas savastanoi]RML97048.1 hypothetical protein ALQ88_00057 [Pseudomonas savastanoi]